MSWFLVSLVTSGLLLLALLALAVLLWRSRRRHFVLFVWGDVEPGLRGPYRTVEERDAAAQDIRREEGPDHGIFALDVTGGVVVDCYSGGFLDDLDNEEWPDDDGAEEEVDARN